MATEMFELSRQYECVPAIQPSYKTISFQMFKDVLPQNLDLSDKAQTESKGLYKTKNIQKLHSRVQQNLANKAELRKALLLKTPTKMVLSSTQKIATGLFKTAHQMRSQAPTTTTTPLHHENESTADNSMDEMTKDSVSKSNYSTTFNSPQAETINFLSINSIQLQSNKPNLTLEQISLASHHFAQH